MRCCQRLYIVQGVASTRNCKTREALLPFLDKLVASPPEGNFSRPQCFLVAFIRHKISTPKDVQSWLRILSSKGFQLIVENQIPVGHSCFVILQLSQNENRNLSTRMRGIIVSNDIQDFQNNILGDERKKLSCDI